MDPEIVAVVGLCLFLVLWYAAGYLYNRRQGQHLFFWLEQGLDVLGSKREAGWLGSPASGARVNILEAHPPFRRLELTLLLERREVPLLWLLDRLRGRRDWLVIKATLRSPGREEWEIGPAPSKKSGPRGTWGQRECLHGLVLTYPGTAAPPQALELSTWIETYGSHVSRLIWQKSDPHIQFQGRVDGLLDGPSRAFLSDFQAAVEKAASAKRET